MLAEQAPTGAGATFVASLLGHYVAIMTLIQGQDVNELSRLSFLMMLGGKCGSQACRRFKPKDILIGRDSPKNVEAYACGDAYWIGKLQTSKWLSCSLVH